MSETIGGVQVCWKKEAGCTSFSFEAGQTTEPSVESLQLQNMLTTAQMHLDILIHPAKQSMKHNVDGISITYCNPRQHLFAYAATTTFENCPCKGGPTGPAYVGNNYYLL